MSWAVRLAACALEAVEREVVLGDLAERGSSGAHALFDVFGLVVRRQLLIWTNWRPWFALLAIAGISGYCLNGMLAALSIGIFEQVEAWLRYGVPYNTGVTSFRDDVIRMTCLAVAIFWLTAVNASILRRLSGRAAWLTGLLFYLVAVDSFAVRNLLSGAVVYRGNVPWWRPIGWVLPLNPASLCLVVFLLVIPGICGALEKLPAMATAAVLSTLVAAFVCGSHAHDMQIYSNGEFPAPSWPVILAPYAVGQLAGPRVSAFPAWPNARAGNRACGLDRTQPAVR